MESINLDSRLHQLNVNLFYQLALLLNKNWEEVLNNMRVDFSRIFTSTYEKDRCIDPKKPGESFLKAMGIRGITVRHLIEAFRNMRFHEGLALLNASEIDEEIIPELKLIAEIKPEKVTSKIGSSIGPISVETNIPHKDLKFQWFHETNGQLEIIQTKTNELMLTNVNIEDSGYYKCQVICELTNENIIPKQGCKVVVERESPFDIKIALLITNANYATIDCDICKKSKWFFHNLQVTESFAKLKTKLEELDFIVLPFLDLDAESFLRAIRYFKEICEGAQSISIFIYVGGHGFHNQYDDHLVPIDVQEDNHAHHHNLDFCSSFDSNSFMPNNKFRLCSLKNLFENLVQLSHDNRLVNVTCLWDLCRMYTYGKFESEPFYKESGNLYYQVIYGCNVGESAFEIANSANPAENGSIVLNNFLSLLHKSSKMQHIWTDVQLEIEKFKQTDPIKFKEVKGIHVHQKVFSQNVTFSVKPNSNKKLKNVVDKLKIKYKKCFFGSKEFSFTLSYGEDCCLNALRIYFEGDIILENKDLHLMKIDYNLFRITRLQRLKDANLKLLLIFPSQNGAERFQHEFEIKNSEVPICRELYSPSINAYVEEKMRDSSMDTRSIITPSIESVYSYDASQSNCEDNDNDS